MSIQNNLLAILPEEISHNILLLLDAHTLAYFSLTYQKANRLAGDDRLWKGLFPDLKTPDTNVKAFLAPFLKRAIASNEDLQQRVREFANKIRLGQTGRFVCQFPCNPDHRISVECYPGTLAAEQGRIPDVEEVWFFMRSLPFERTETSHLFPGRNFVFVRAELPADEFKNMRIKKLGKIVNERLRMLQAQPQPPDANFETSALTALGVAALATVSLGIYITQRT